MQEAILDTRLQGKLRKIIAENLPDRLPYSKSIFYCGSKVLHQTGTNPAVFLLSNGEHSRFYGNTSCKNAWACPVCSAKLMAKYAAEIACAIDALAQPKYNQKAFMITFTIPHTRGMSCEETTEILYNTWKDFVIHGNKTVKANNKTGKDKRWTMYDPFALFCETFNCKHRVRVGEFTYGEHGWHPHFHCLFWVDKDKIKYAKSWENTLSRRWLELAKKNTIKYWDKMAKLNHATKVVKDDSRSSDSALVVVGNKNEKVGVGLGKAAEVPEAICKGVDDAKKNNRIRAEIMYSRLNDGSVAAYISVDKNGEVIVQKSSMYICGWGADRELTGNYQNKATAEGHLTPRQILEKATTEPGDKFAQLYMDFVKAVRTKRHTRINFSTRSGIKQIIAEYKKTNQYIETLKKKATTNPKLGMRVVCWFTEQQWRSLYWTETQIQDEIRAKLLELAKERDKRLIEEYLLQFGIDISKNPPHKLEEHINGIMNSPYYDVA